MPGPKHNSTRQVRINTIDEVLGDLDHAIHNVTEIETTIPTIKENADIISRWAGIARQLSELQKTIADMAV